MSKPVKRYDICAGRPYTTGDGEDKKHWIQVGRMTEWDEGGPSIELFAMPAGAWFDGKLSCFEQKPRDGEQKPAAQRPQRSAPAPRQSGNDFADDDIPF